MKTKLKTSQKLLIALGVLIVALVITTITFLRRDILPTLEKEQLKTNYKTLAAGEFNNVDFSTDWNAKIVHGTEFKVEIDLVDSLRAQYKIERKGDTLSLRSLHDETFVGMMRARITTPYLRSIKSSGGTSVTLEGFYGDSISVMIADGGAFMSYNNNFRYVSMKTSGDVRLQWTKDE